MNLSRTIAAAAILLVLSVPSRGETAVFDDFEAYVSGSSIHGQGGWNSTAGVNVVYDTTEENQLLQLMSINSNVYKPLGDLSIDNGQTGTLFFRFQADSNAVDHRIAP